MYREKLLSQIAVLEQAQKSTSDIQSIQALSRDILCLSKKVNELDEDTKLRVEISKDSRMIEAMTKELAKSYSEKHGVSPKESIEIALKETLKEIKD